MSKSVEVKDIPWAALALTRKALFSALPIRAHMEIAHLRGRGPMSSVPAQVRDNIETILGDRLDSSEVQRIARRHFQFIKRAYLVEILPLLRGFNDPDRWPVHGLEHLDEAFARNRGVILATAHLGYPRLMTPILNAYGYEVKQVVAEGSGRLMQKRQQEEVLTKGSRFRRWVFERTRVSIDRVSSRDIVANLDVRPIFKALSSNQAVMIVGDGMRAVEFAQLSLLGRKYPLPTGFMKIAMMTQAALLPVFVVDGDRRNRIRVEIHPPLEIDPAGDVVTNLQLYADVLDAQIHRTPHLWNRWYVKDLFDTALEWSESEIRARHDARWHHTSRKSRLSRVVE